MNYQQSLSWVARVIASCKTMAHVSGALKLLVLFRKQFINQSEPERDKLAEYDRMYNMLDNKRKQFAV